jgi:hypothetical protein
VKWETYNGVQGESYEYIDPILRHEEETSLYQHKHNKKSSKSIQSTTSHYQHNQINITTNQTTNTTTKSTNMSSTHAAYYNVEADKAAEASRKSSASSNSSANNTQSRRSSIKKVLDGFRFEKVQPSGTYTPIIKNSPLFSRKKSEEWNKLSRYQKNAAVAHLMC